MLAALTGLLPAASAEARPALFGTSESYSADLRLFPKWRSVMSRFAAESRNCKANPCMPAAWSSLLDGLRGRGPLTQMRRVNGALNARPYVIDAANWRRADYWATPFQFMRRSGDCEDYAIAKYLVLRRLGFSADDLRIVVLRDLDVDMPHAVLAVYVGERIYILDNRTNAVLAADRIDYFRPFYSLNENGWWLHRS